jgi:acyl-CoA reductase-like NAD-dependent aldehyde dehydrogenase
MYVCDEIDNIANTATAAVEGVFYNNGQSCCAVKRIYVHEKIYDEFLSAFVLETKKLVPADPAKLNTKIGAVSRKSHLDFLDFQIKDAVMKGAKIECGGQRIVGIGAYFAPTVLSNVNHDMSIMKDETFGPVIGIQKVKDDASAIQLMNDTQYGLTASVYSSNIARAESILRKLDTGTAYINCCDRVSPYLPWSGRKHSGLGASLSFLGILAFAKPRGWHIRQEGITTSSRRNQ